MIFVVTIANTIEMVLHEYEQYTLKRVKNLTELMEDVEPRMKKHCTAEAPEVRAVIAWEDMGQAKQKLMKDVNREMADKFLSGSPVYLEYNPSKKSEYSLFDEYDFEMECVKDSYNKEIDSCLEMSTDDLETYIGEFCDEITSF
uniref:ORF71 n=1 Tax=Malaco herpesvirus 1 TaxID=3031797 RepID=A0AA48P7X7_9VIRU|nr:TPA_asm: ORF71 [Malaco herpesvirus 1]